MKYAVVASNDLGLQTFLRRYPATKKAGKMIRDPRKAASENRRKPRKRWRTPPSIELRQYKNDSMESKCMFVLKLPCFFPHTVQASEKARQFQKRYTRGLRRVVLTFVFILGVIYEQLLTY